MTIQTPVDATVVSFRGKASRFTPEALRTLRATSTLVQNSFLDTMAMVVGTTTYRMGPRPGTLTATEIVYHRLQVDDTTHAASYMAGSGIYVNKTTGQKVTEAILGDFLSAVQSGNPSGSTLVTLASGLHNPFDAPSIMLWHDSFVVVDLVSPTFKFRVDQSDASPANWLDAVETHDPLAASYYDLVHIDTTGAPYNQATSTACQRFYFYAVAPTGTDSDDPFNLYLEMDHPTRIDFVILDPFIKNRGGH